MILFASNHDYACFSHNMANAYRTVRDDVVDLALHTHKFGYHSQSALVERGRMERMMQQAEEIHIMHSDPTIMQMAMRWKKESCKLIHWATGTRYRQDPEKVNRLFNPYVEMTIIALTEFAELGAKNPHYLVGAIDTDQIKPERYYEGETPQIYHLPSCTKTKGTDTILNIVRSLEGDFNFEYKVDPCSHDVMLNLMQKCDIYLELFAPEQDGKPYGSWGITALEAAAMGKIVFTQMNDIDIYCNSYTQIPKLFMLNDSDKWIECIQGFIDKPIHIKAWQELAREWVVKNHSYQATGKKMKKIFGC